MRTIAVFSVKGGVGKTSTAVNLAWCASRDHRTVLWDLDPQGSASFLLDATARGKGTARAVVRGKTSLSDLTRSTDDNQLAVIPAHESFRALDLELEAVKRSPTRLRTALGSVGRKVEVAVLDCPPGMSGVAEAVLTAADVIVVPLVPGPLSLRSLEQVIELVRQTGRPKPKVVAFLSMVDRRKSLHQRALLDLPQESRHVVAPFVPYSSVVERMGVEHSAVGEFAPRSTAATSYAELWSAVSAAARL